MADEPGALERAWNYVVRGGPFGGSEGAQAANQPWPGEGPLPPTFPGTSDPVGALKTDATKALGTEWAREPDVKKYPTAQEAQEARDYRQRFGNVNEQAIDTGMPMGREDYGEFAKRIKQNPPAPVGRTLPLDPREADYFQQTQMVSNMQPLSSGRFDINKTSRYPQPMGVGGASGAELRGQVWVNPGDPSFPGAHEWTHDTFQDLLKHPEALKILKTIDRNIITRQDLEKGLTTNELIARANTQRHFGPDSDWSGEKPTGQRQDTDIGRYQVERTQELLRNPEFQRYMQALDKIGGQINAQRQIRKQGGVMKKGGRVRRFLRGGNVEDQDEPEQPIQRAQREMQLTPQEGSLYERHLGNLWGPGGRDTTMPGSDLPARQTLYIGTNEVDGRHYLIPSIYNGQEATQEQALALAEQQGLHNFPSYPTREEADARYKLLHRYMEDDTRKYYRAKGYQKGGRVQGPKGQRALRMARLRRKQ